MHWLKKLNARFYPKQPLKQKTTLRVGGAADFWVEPKSREELKEILVHCRKRKIPYLVIGKGSNLLFSDRGFRGLIICLSAAAFTKISVNGKCICCGAGTPLFKILNKTQQSGRGGLEFLAGIPASLGGALVMNAGGLVNNIGRLVQSVTVMDERGKIQRINKQRLKFNYRQSNLAKFIVLEAEFSLPKRSPEKIRHNIAAQLARKRETQDLAARSAGCIFKNPVHLLTAGQMIEACGLKRRHKGDAQISGKHANYIINRRRAKARDILYLIRLAQREVKKKFGVDLEPEIKIIK